MAIAAPTRPTPRPPQIDACATVGGRRANGGAFIHRGRPEVGRRARLQLRVCMACDGFVAVSGRFVVAFCAWSDLFCCLPGPLG